MEDWETKSAFLAKGNLAILLFTKENNNWTKDKIDPQHLYLHLQVIKSILHGDVGFILAVILCFHETGCLLRVSIPEWEFDPVPLLGWTHTPDVVT